ncbi:hypothetical protein [Acinetobacter baumannii]|uniref:hypothetical protein n=1 Tax=Acinetobacter baumannii TaxID=470 RepID=UPI0002D0F78D|nr:hypothetical protein [Acinetobacter baumannii]ENU65007.1 hypothetical protein F979_03084 [Acinetobacter baumannii NIPH 146]HDX6154252.1 hypothetical protein [Acinetobacter baumannii]
MDNFEEAWKANRHVWESTKNLAKAMYLAGQQSQQAKVEELQNLYTQQGINMLKLQRRVDAALEQVQGNLKYVEQDRRENFEFLQMAMIRAFKELEQALKGENNEF